MPDIANRFARQDGLIRQDVLAPLEVTVIGVGAIGRQVALQLGALGVRKLKLVDFDNVEITNVTTQGYLAQDIGSSKVQATARTVRQIDSEIDLSLVEDRFRPQPVRRAYAPAAADRHLLRPRRFRLGGRSSPSISFPFRIKPVIFATANGRSVQTQIKIMSAERNNRLA
jgi:hypothetical protein